MNAYEIMLLLDAELAEDRQAEILTRTRELVTQRGGAWQSEDSWGRRKLAYEIDKKPEAFYYLLQFDCDAETLAELTRVLKITDGVLRHLAVRRLPPGRRCRRASPRRLRLASGRRRRRQRRRIRSLSRRPTRLEQTFDSRS